MKTGIRMKNVNQTPILALLFACALMVGCGEESKDNAPSETETEAENLAAPDGEDASATKEEDAGERVENPDPVEEEVDGESVDTVEDEDTVTEDVTEGACQSNADCVPEVPLEACFESVCDKGECLILPSDEGTECQNDDNACFPPVGSCDGAGACVLDEENATVCDDGNPCTDDSCAPDSGCIFEPNTEPCDDGTVCTEEDTCSNGQCAGQPRGL